MIEMFQHPPDARRKVMQDLAKRCNLEDKVLIDLGSKFGHASNEIKSKRRIKVDINKNVKPDILCDLSSSIPIKDDAIDICIAGEILEHIYNSKRFVEEMKRILKDGGYAIVSVPNVCSLKYRIKFLFGGIPAHAAKADCTFPEPWHWGHVRDYNFTELTSLFKQRGFEVIDEKTSALSLFGKVIVPNYLLWRTLGDDVIIRVRKK